MFELLWESASVTNNEQQQRTTNNNMTTQQEELTTRWNMLSDFVQKTCAGRDESHGHAHMQAVATTARYLVQVDFTDRRHYHHLILDAITAAWLHDIADHKYAHDGTLQQTLDDFGYKHISNYEHIKKVIKYVSYSSENKAILAGTPLDYDTLLTPYYALVRHIVSDADKLEAIGQIGIMRAIEYTRHANPTYTEQQVVADVCKHANEKLLRLATEFIRTPTARALAQQRHQEMAQWVTTHGPQ